MPNSTVEKVLKDFDKVIFLSINQGGETLIVSKENGVVQINPLDTLENIKSFISDTFTSHDQKIREEERKRAVDIFVKEISNTDYILTSQGGKYRFINEVSEAITSDKKE